ncbi:MAG: competence/damage-inducible protein A [Clostridia bacterium]|nr:competence/damage-inducible protein A [Clostridia bacterium]
MTCELVFVGTELLLGDILNTNAQYLSRQLAAIGISVLHQSVVGDNPDRLRQVLETAFSRADTVLTTGGLGPTKDDLTKEVCADLFQKKLVLHDESLRRMKDYFDVKGVVMPKTNEKQAWMPEGAVIFENTNGTAPGCAMEQDGKRLLMLPGPPREMKAMFECSALPYLRQFSDGVICSREIRTFGIGESSMAQTVSDLLDKENPTVAPYAKSGEAMLRVTAKAATETEAEALLEPVVQEILQRLDGYVYGVDVPNIETAVVRELLRRNISVATAESATAGLIAKRLTDVPGASAVFGCGIVSYQDHIKEKLLLVDPRVIEKDSAVCETVAVQMAQGARAQSGADLAVSVTGLAGPGKDDRGRDPGLAYLALTDGRETFTRTVNTGQTGPDCRDFNRTVFSSQALDLIRCYLRDHPDAAPNA